MLKIITAAAALLTCTTQAPAPIAPAQATYEIVQILHGQAYVQDYNLTLDDCAQAVVHYPHGFCRASLAQPE